jgi:two-component system response regulator HydG
MHGGAFLDAVRKANPSAGSVVYGRGVNAEDAVTWMKAGVIDVILDPEGASRVKEAIGRAFAHSASLSAEKSTAGAVKVYDSPFIYRSRAIEDLMVRVRKVAPVKATVLLTGESGTGKDLLSRQIHALSGRSGPYLALNCAAIPETLLENELFGHERGAFTGAERMAEGRFEAARGGTLLLDEIGEIPPGTQVKLLRALEEEQVTRLGGTKPVPTDVRLIAATNSDLAARVRNGSFRKDLYYRLKVVELYIPPLRARKQDIPLLAVSFVRDAAERHGLPVPTVDPEVLSILSGYSWPGNVRQLRNLMESLVIMSGTTISPDDIPDEISGSSAKGSEVLKIELPRSLDEIEEMVIERTLALAGGNRTRAAEMLGIGRRTLQRKLGGD